MSKLKYFLLGSLALAAQYSFATEDVSWRGPVEALATYDYGHERTQILALHAYLNAQNAAGRVPVEEALIRLLAKPGLPAGARDEACRFLAVMGTERSLPTLGQMAADPVAGFLAIDALMDIPGSVPTLLKALPGAPEKNQEAILGALGRVRDPSAVPQLIQFAKGKGPVAEAALTALGAVGTEEAVRALGEISPPDDPRLVAAWAKLNGATRLEGHPAAKAQVAEVFRSLLASPAGSAVRVASAIGLTRTEGTKALAALMPLLADPDRRVRAGVAEALPAVPGAGTAVITAWSKLDPAVQLVLVSACTGSAPDGEQILRHALSVSDPSLQIAAVQALGLRDGDGSIAVLLPLLSTGGEVSTAAAESLSRLSGPDTTKKLRAAFASSKGNARILLLTIAANRQDRAAWQDALTATTDPDPAARAAAFRAVGLLAGPDDLPAVIALLPNIKDPSDRSSWSKTLLAASRNSPAPDAAALVLNEALTSAPAESRQAFLLALAGLSSPQAATSLRTLMQSPDLETRKEIIRTLSSIRNPLAQELLLQAAKQGQDPAEKILALRGYLDGLKAQTDAAPETLAKFYTEAWDLAERQQERDAILASLKALKGDAAKKSYERLAAVSKLDGNS